MKTASKTYIDVEIDKLTNSIENVVSGDIFDAEVVQLTKDSKQIKKTEWLFDWDKQLNLLIEKPTNSLYRTIPTLYKV